jgi:hypothetical protein
MGHRSGKLGHWQCGAVGRHMLMTSEGNDSQNQPRHQQGVTRPQLILAVVSAEILRMRSTLPSSGCTMSTLMLAKWLSLWWRDFCQFIVSGQIAGNECWEVVTGPRHGRSALPLKLDSLIKPSYCNLRKLQVSRRSFSNSKLLSIVIFLPLTEPKKC